MDPASIGWMLFIVSFLRTELRRWWFRSAAVRILTPFTSPVCVPDSPEPCRRHSGLSFAFPVALPSRALPPVIVVTRPRCVVLRRTLPPPPRLRLPAGPAVLRRIRPALEEYEALDAAAR